MVDNGCQIKPQVYGTPNKPCSMYPKPLPVGLLREADAQALQYPRPEELRLLEGEALQQPEIGAQVPALPPPPPLAALHHGQ